ncbi:MAG: CAP domain-containing protein [Deltaproteobacteria bacterium]|nr:CAP domain-containing protein [Deltaproteobacteria bacterium]
MRSYFFISFLMFISIPYCLFAETTQGDIDEKALNHLNRLRKMVSMKSFQINPYLDVAAKNHAKYLVENGQIGHLEQPGLLFFTGVYPVERAMKAGYASKNVSENLSLGQADGAESINGLMSAIYHRFGFLGFLNDEIGIGIIKGNHGQQYVYMMGNRSLSRFCGSTIYMDESVFYQDACKHRERVSAEKYDFIQIESLKNNPPVVLWPPPDSDFVDGVFFEESPDPLPDLNVSGYPVSLQLNPHFFKEIRLNYFRLYSSKDNSEIRNVRILSQKNDPNHKLTRHQFALFPLKRLDWGTQYRVEAGIFANGKNQKWIWSFKVRSLAQPLVTIQAKGESIYIQPGKKYAIYFPPQKNLPYIEKLKWEMSDNVKTKIDWEDKNTINITALGEICQKITFFINDQRFFQVFIGALSYAKPNKLSELSFQSCEK